MITDRSARNAVQRARMERRRANRAVVDGRLTSLDPRCPHGDRTGYVSYACRCLLCTKAEWAYNSAYQARSRVPAA